MSGFAVSKKTGFTGKRVNPPVLRRNNLLAKSRSANRAKPRSIAKVRNNNVNTRNSTANIPTLYKEPDREFSVSHLLAQSNPHSYSPEYYQKALTELKRGLKIIGVFLFLVYLGWTATIKANTTESGDLIYNTGLIGGCLMLAALIYSLIKRIKFLRNLLASDMWYYLHIGCGAVGAYLVLLHSSFDLRSINASVGLVTTLIVITSGALGRYLYTLSTISLHRQLVAVQETEQSLFNLVAKYERDRALKMRERLSRFTFYCFSKPRSRLLYIIRWVAIAYLVVYVHQRSRRDLRKITKNISKLTRLKKRDIAILKRYQKKKLREYIFLTAKMGYTSLVEQVFRHWRILHIPALYLLTLTAVVHVIGVHMF